MTDKLKESVSALVDNEADELELRRILAQSHDKDVLESWHHYHQLRASLNHEEARWVGVDLRQGINAALDETDANEQIQIDDSIAESEVDSVKPEQHSGKRWWASLAIAASVAFAVVVSVQFAVPGLQNNSPVVAGNEVANPPLVSPETTAPQSFSKEHEARLNEYIMRHTGHAALNTGKSIVPFARLTSFEPEE